MTTAARPTWAPAKGGNEQGGARVFGPSQKYSSRDMAAHTSLKPRRESQDTKDEVEKRNLHEELEERERRQFSSKDKSYSDDRDRRRGNQLLLEGTRRDAEDRIVPRNVDADDFDVEVKSDDESDDDDDDDNDDEEETKALLAELEQIKKERAEEQLRMACSAHSLICVRLYDTLGPGAVNFILDHAEIDFAFVQDKKVKEILNPDCILAQRLKGEIVYLLLQAIIVATAPGLTACPLDLFSIA